MPNGEVVLVLVDNFGFTCDEDLQLYEDAVRNTRRVINDNFGGSQEVANIFLDNYEKSDTVSIKPELPLCLYLMVDARNGLHKIGKSVKPPRREKTLQSEEPAIIMVFYSEITHQGQSESFFHEKFKNKRVRGEWFNLSQDDIDYIKASFQK